MKIRKMRKGIRRKAVVRRRRRSSTSRGSATEIKYLSLQSQDQACKLCVTATNSDSLFAGQYFFANALDNIQQGTNFTNRIGNKIYAMSINVHFLVYGCPSASTYNIDQFIIRHLWHNQRVNANNQVDGFFGVSTRVNFNSFVDRKSVIVHRDKYFPVKASAYATSTTGSTTNCGAVREIEYSIPINRYVQYTQSGVVKEDKDVYSFAVLSATTNMSNTYDLRQVACFQAKYRIYFKDA